MRDAAIQHAVEAANPLPADAYDWPLLERLSWLETLMRRYEVPTWHLVGRLHRWIDDAAGQFPQPPEPWRLPFEERAQLCRDLGFREFQILDNRRWAEYPVAEGWLSGNTLHFPNQRGGISRVGVEPNPITSDIVRIARSLALHGFVNPIGLDDRLNVQVGNERLRAIYLLRWPYSVPVTLQR